MGPGGDFKKRLNEATATSFSRSLLNTVFSIYNAGINADGNQRRRLRSLLMLAESEPYCDRLRP